MGRIKTQLIKRTTLKLYSENKGLFTKDYNKNKELVAEIVNFPSKKIKYVVAGYLTRLVKTEKEL